MRRDRDTQRKRLYDAEDAAHHAFDGTRGKQTIPNDELQAWVDKVMGRSPIVGRWGVRKIAVRLTHGGGRSYGGHIRLGVWARNPWVVLHEIAHELTYYRDDGAAHGPEFAGVFLFLVRTVLGAEAARELRQAYRHHRVRTSNRAIPAYDADRIHRVQVRAAERRAAAAMPPSRQQMREAAEILRRAARSGVLGESTRKPRVHALATARLLDGLATGTVSQVGGRVAAKR